MAVAGRPRSTRLLVVGLVSLSLLVITIDYKQGESGPLAGLGRGAVRVMGPLQEAVSNLTRPVGNFFSALIHLPSQQARIKALEAQLREARSQLTSNTSDQVRLRYLEKLFGIAKALDAPTATGRVISNGVSNFEWSVMIDVGSGDGVQPDDPVVSGGGLVGHVTRVTPSYSMVQLIVDPRSFVAVQLTSSGRTGLLQGQGEDDMRMQFFQPDTPVAQADTVETAGFRLPNGEGSLYPAAIPVGTVSHVIEDPAALEKFVTVRPAVDFSSLDFVLVVLMPGVGG